MGIKKSIEKIRELTKKIKITKLNRKKCKINETKISAYTPVPFPFPTVSKDLSIPELSPQKKRNRHKLHLQFAESMGQLKLAEWK